MMPPLEYGLPLDQLVACHECDLLLRKPTLKSGERSDCPRCGYELDAHRYNLLKHNLALVVTALQLYVPANLLPIMHLKLLGQRSDDTVWGAVRGLYDTGMYGITTVVFLCSMAVPFLKFTCQLTVLLSIQLNFCLHYRIWFYRFYHTPALCGDSVHASQCPADHDGQYPGTKQPGDHHVGNHYPNTGRHAADRSAGVHRQIWEVFFIISLKRNECIVKSKKEAYWLYLPANSHVPMTSLVPHFLAVF